MVLKRKKMSNGTIRHAVNEWCRNREAAKKIYGSIEDWDTSLVTDMGGLFRGKAEFNDDISR